MREGSEIFGQTETGCGVQQAPQKNNVAILWKKSRRTGMHSDDESEAKEQAGTCRRTKGGSKNQGRMYTQYTHYKDL